MVSLLAFKRVDVLCETLDLAIKRASGAEREMANALINLTLAQTAELDVQNLDGRGGLDAACLIGNAHCAGARVYGRAIGTILRLAADFGAEADARESARRTCAGSCRDEAATATTVLGERAMRSSER